MKYTDKQATLEAIRKELHINDVRDDIGLTEALNKLSRQELLLLLGYIAPLNSK